MKENHNEKLVDDYFVSTLFGGSFKWKINYS